MKYKRNHIRSMSLSTRSSFFGLLLSAFLVIYSCKSEFIKNDNDENWKKRIKLQEVLKKKPEKIAEFTEILKTPSLVYLDDEMLYMIDRHTNTIIGYSRESYNPVVKFGNKGEGAGEFRWINSFGVYPHYLFVNSTGKISFFSQNGKLEKEKKSEMGLMKVTPIGNNFVCFDHSLPMAIKAHHRYSRIRIVLLNSNLEREKTLLEGEIRRNARFNDKTSMREILRFPDCMKFVVYKKRIYIGSSGEGFCYSVYDSDGKKLYDIKKPYQKRRVTEREKKKTREQIRKRGDKWRRMEVSFFEYYPAYKDFQVSDDKIYTFLYPKEEEETIIILNLKGQFLKSVVIPTFDNLIRTNVVHKGSLFYLKDNPESENWELWKLKIHD